MYSEEVGYIVGLEIKLVGLKSCSNILIKQLSVLEDNDIDNNNLNNQITQIEDQIEYIEYKLEYASRYKRDYLNRLFNTLDKYSVSKFKID